MRTVSNSVQPAKSRGEQGVPDRNRWAFLAWTCYRGMCSSPAFVCSSTWEASWSKECYHLASAWRTSKPRGRGRGKILFDDLWTACQERPRKTAELQECFMPWNDKRSKGKERSATETFEKNDVGCSGEGSQRTGGCSCALRLQHANGAASPSLHGLMRTPRTFRCRVRPSILPVQRHMHLKIQAHWFMKLLTTACFKGQNQRWDRKD